MGCKHGHIEDTCTACSDEKKVSSLQQQLQRASRILAVTQTLAREVGAVRAEKGRDYIRSLEFGEILDELDAAVSST